MRGEATVESEGEFLDAKGKPIFMNRENGDSKVVVALPARLPKGVAAWPDITVLVIDNGIGIAAAIIPWE